MTTDQQPDTTQSSDALEKKFETIFEHANDAIFIVDIENDDIVDCNPAAEELVEYSSEELMSMPASDLHPHNLPQFMSFAETVFDQGHGWTDDITCYCKSGDIIPAEMSASVIELDGRPHLVNHIRSTTDSEERDWFEALLEHSSDLITVVKPDGTIRYQSDSVDNILGYSPDELQDRRYMTYLHPDDTAEMQTILETMGDRSGGVVQRQEYRFRRAEGTWAWLEGIVSSRPDAPISGYLINARDITARRESHQQAMVLNRVLRHNLRNDINVVQAHAKMLSDGDSESVATSAEMILSKTADLLDLTGYTRDIADMIGSQHVPQQRHDLTRLVDQEVETLRQQYPHADFDLDLPQGQFVLAAPKLDVALDHVLTNAVAHNNSDQPQVDVTVRPPETTDGYAKICVVDNGPGIPTQEREVLLEGTEAPLKHGSGLGLWLVNWIVNRSGGYIAFDDNEPRGSQVTLALPVTLSGQQ
jgi:PAS domain S-box-containing protein